MKKHQLIFGLILLFAFVTRIWRVSIPSNFYFDEVYHAFTAQAYAVNDPRGYEWWHKAPEGVAYEWLHPPVSKLIMGFSIFLLGDHSFAWRFPSVLIGVLSIVAIYKLTHILFNNKQLALLAAFIASLDGLLITQSRIAMNDIYVTFFVITTLGLYFTFTTRNTAATNSGKWWALLAGTTAGLALSSKWSGVFLVGIVASWEWWLSRNRFASLRLWLLRWISVCLLILSSLWLGVGLWSLGKFLAISVVGLVWLAICGLVASIVGLKRLVLLFACFVVVPAIVYLGSFGQFWLQSRPDNIDIFINLHKQIWWYQTNLDATHPYQSTPWQWILNLKPVWFYVDWQSATTANIYALANPAIAWLGLVSIILVAGISWLIGNQSGLFLLVSYLWVWLPWTISPRIMFFYHYTPAIPMLAIALAWITYRLWVFPFKLSKVASGVVVLCIVGMFGYFYPFWTGLPVPKGWVDQYYWFESWR